MLLTKLWSLFLEIKTQSINCYYLAKVYHVFFSSANFRVKLLKHVISVAIQNLLTLYV